MTKHNHASTNPGGTAEAPIRLTTPVSDAALRELCAGALCFVSGTVYTARDAAHQRLTAQLRRGEAPPFDFRGQIVFYAGPCPARPGETIGSVGPTTGGRMDKYAPELIAAGLKIMIGKGTRSEAVKTAIITHGGVYFAAIGGAAALMSRCVTKAEIIAFPDLGTEAIRRLTVENLPVIVALDATGRSGYAVV